MALQKCCCCGRVDNGAFIISVCSIMFHGIAFCFLVDLDFTQYYGQSDHLPFLCIVEFVYFIASVLMCVGVVAKNHYLMMPWLLISGLVLIPLLPFALLASLVVIPIFGPYYIWFTVRSAYQWDQNDNQH